VATGQVEYPTRGLGTQDVVSSAVPFYKRACFSKVRAKPARNTHLSDASAVRT